MRLLLRLPLAALVLCGLALAPGSATAVATSPPPMGEVVALTDLNLDAAAAASPVLLMLHASWCGHCRKFMPSYGRVAGALADDGILVAKSDASVHRMLAQRFELTGFPSFYLIDNGKAYEFTGRRSIEGLVDFARGGGKEAAREMRGWAKPMGVLWVHAAKLLAWWEATRTELVKEKYTPSVVVACVAGGCMVMLVLFAGIINCVTKPATRQSQERGKTD